jgi:hypothetical protein
MICLARIFFRLGFGGEYMFRNFGFISITFILVLAGCGDKNLPTLNNSQKALFQQTLASLGQLPAALEPLANQAPNTPVSSPIQNVQPPVFPQPSVRNLNANQLALTQYLEATIDNGQCSVSANLGNLSTLSSQAITGGNLYSIISGVTCPIQMTLLVTFGYGSSPSGTFSWTLNTTDRTFLALNDIDSINITGNISGNYTTSAELSASGNFHSQKQGNLGFYANFDYKGPSASASGDFTLGVKYPTYSAELEASVQVNGQNAPTLNFSINHEPMTEEDFSNYVSAIFPSAQSQMTWSH